MTKYGVQADTNYYHYNARGDVVQLTDNNGVEVANYTYDAWGNIKSSSGPMADGNPVLEK